MNRKYARTAGRQRDELRAEAVRVYSEGQPIRVVAEQIGRSFGATRTLLVEAGVQLRPRGWSQRRGAA
jgi:hypothetical protein